MVTVTTFGGVKIQSFHVQEIFLKGIPLKHYVVHRVKLIVTKINVYS